MTTLIDPQDLLQVDFVVDLLRAKRPVALPTETVYGLAALAIHEEALARIFELKARPHFDPLIIHVLDWERAQPWVRESSLLHEKLAKAFWPGPLTLLFRKSKRIPDLCTAGSEWVAVRSPQHPAFRMILERLDGLPLAAPSANRFASISPTCSSDVVRELGPFGIEAVVEGGASELGLESTVVKIVSDSEIEILRPGSLAVEQIAEVLGSGVRISVRASGSGVEEKAAGHESPGQHRIHYAPSKPLHLLKEKDLANFLRDRGVDVSRAALVEVFPIETSIAEQFTWGRRVCLSRSGSWTEAASKLFATLRSLDSDKSIDILVALECAQESLGLAISDRLRRASAKTT